MVRQTFRRGGDAGSVGGGLFGEDIRVCVEISVPLAKIIATLLPTLIAGSTKCVEKPDMEGALTAT